MGAEGDAVKQHEQEEHAQVQPEIDEGGHVFGQHKHILWYIHLGKNMCICHQGVHTAVGGLPGVGEDQIAAEQIDRVMWSISSKKLGEDQAQYQQIQKR